MNSSSSKNIYPLDKVKGQSQTVSYLKDLHSNKKWPKALLFYGREGTGKLFCALQYAKHINMTGDFETDQRLISMVDSGTHPDIHVFKKEEDESSFKIDVIRESLEEANKPRAEARKRVIIFGDIQDFPSHKQSDALLKTIEDGFEDTLFIFTVTNLELVFPTLRSRTVTTHFAPLSDDIIYDLLDAPEELDEDEKILASRLCSGSLDRALRLVQPSKEESLTGFELRNRAFSLFKNLRRTPVHIVLKFIGKIPEDDQPLFFDFLFGIVHDVLLLEENIEKILNQDRLEDVLFIKEDWEDKSYRVFDAFKNLHDLRDRRGLAFSHQLQNAILTGREGLNDDN